MKTNVAQTSIAAHNDIHPVFAANQQEQVFNAIKAAWSSGATISELAHMLGLEKSSVSARRNALLASGRIELGDERKCRITGRTVQTVRVKPQQGELN